MSHWEVCSKEKERFPDPHQYIEYIFIERNTIYIFSRRIFFIFRVTQYQIRGTQYPLQYAQQPCIRVLSCLPRVDSACVLIGLLIRFLINIVHFSYKKISVAGVLPFICLYQPFLRAYVTGHARGVFVVGPRIPLPTQTGSYLFPFV